jgi:hypothetical protein
MILAQFVDFGLTENVLQVVRIIAAIGGAVVGWFAFDPLTRLCYRLIYRTPTPVAVLFTSKGCAAAILATLIYVFIPLGGGGGLGWGPGKGGSPGKGPGEGGDKVVKDGPTKDGTANVKDKDKTDPIKPPSKLDQVQIEILGGKRFEDDGKDRFYLIERKKPAVAIDEVDAYFKKQQGKIEVVAVLTKDTGIELDLIGSPLDKLRKRAADYKIKVLTLNED